MSEMYGKVILVTPEMAQNWKNSCKKNRTLRSVNLEKIMRAMQNGTFMPTHQGIALTADGELIDGNHRCEGIIRTGIPQKVFVIFNAPKVAPIDCGSNRTVKDQLYMAGIIEKGSKEWNKLCNPLVNQILKRNYTEKEISGFSAMDRHNTYLAFKKTIDKTIDCVYPSNRSGASYRSCLITYPMACAINAGVSEQKVKEWHRILSTGDFYSEDEIVMKAGRSIAVLFKQFIDNGRSYKGSRRETDIVTIKKAMSSIDYFTKNIEVQKLYGAFIYPDLKVNL